MSNWGGRREGAGRPAPDGPRVSLNCRVKPETLEALRHMETSSIGKAVDMIVEDYLQGKAGE